MRFGPKVVLSLEVCSCPAASVMSPSWETDGWVKKCTGILYQFFSFSGSLTKHLEFLKQLKVCFLNETVLVYPLSFLSQDHCHAYCKN